MPSNAHIQQPESKKQKSKLEALLTSLGNALEHKFSSYRGARELKENEWALAVKQYEGLWDEQDIAKIEMAFNQGYNRENEDLPPSVNITRPRTIAAIAKMQDIQFPTGGDYNFQLQTAPLSEAMRAALGDDNVTSAQRTEFVRMGLSPDEAPSPAQVAQARIDEEAEACRLMEESLRQRLIDAKYGNKGRRAINDLAILGTGIIKGPVLDRKMKRVYTLAEGSGGETIQVLDSVENELPELYRVDPRLFYPTPAARVPEEIVDCFELHLLDKSRLIELAASPAFMKDQIREVLKHGPDSKEVPSSITETHNNIRNQATPSTYVVKEYHGCLDKEVLFSAGKITQEEYDDPLQEYFGEVWVCNKHVIRISLNAMEGADRVPYSLACWEMDPASVFGHGVPFLLRHPQRVVNNAYMLLLENAALTSGPQIVLNREMIEPADPDGSYDIVPQKVWVNTDLGGDVREAMQFVDVPSAMGGISQIIDMAIQFADMESSTPQIAQGEMPVGNNTMSGMARVFSAYNVNQKRASMNWDDNITLPMIERLYHYEMQYGENEAVKGQYVPCIGGATERIDAEMRSTELERMLGLASQDPDFKLQLDPTKAFRELVTLTRVGDILRSSKEVEEERARVSQEAAQAQQENPQGQAAQAQIIQAQARVQEAQMKAEIAMAELQFKQQEAMQNAQLKAAELQMKMQESESRLMLAQAEREAAMMKLAAEREISIAELQANFATSQQEMQVAREKMQQEREQFNTEISVKMQTGEGI